jgi:hypothetical protein
MSERNSVWFRPLWLGSLIAISAAITIVFTCVTPFAAFAVIAAVTAPRRDAVMLTVALWLANQAVGFGLLRYPWTGSTFAWGAALGVAAVIGTLGALWTFERLGSLKPFARSVLAFVAAFALYQLALYAVAAFWLGGGEMFAPGIVRQVLLINAVTLGGLFALRPVVASASALLIRRRAHTPPARLA